jgi:hypothetical protein
MANPPWFGFGDQRSDALFTKGAPVWIVFVFNQINTNLEVGAGVVVMFAAEQLVAKGSWSADVAEATV